MESINYHSLPETEVLSKLNTSIKGLSRDEVEQRFLKFGYNELKAEKKISAIKVLLEQFSSPLIWILIAALIISIFLKETTDAIVIGIIIIINAILGFVQEYRAERAIEALQRMAAPQAKVIRNDQLIKLDSRYLVPGDIIVLETGDNVPADCRLIEVHSLEAEEAHLTGESHPITKELKLFAEKTILAERKNMVYSSTIITNGRGKAVVTSTGMKTEVGKIARMIQEATETITPLQKKLKELGKYLTIIVIAVAFLVFLAGVFTGKDISVMFLTAVALAVAAIPEGLPAVITISLAIGVQKMVKKNALIRKLPSVETLGSVNVICTDKTGTLTHNQMTVKKIWVNNLIYEVSGSGYDSKGQFTQANKPANPEDLNLLLKIGALCNDAKLNRVENKIEVIGDPTEAALIISAEKIGFKLSQLSQEEPRTDEIPFTSERKLMTTIHQTKKEIFSYTKGAPEIVLQSCNRILVHGKIQSLTPHKKKEIFQEADDFAKQALRVLGFAYNEKFGRKENAESEMIFVGLEAMMDPPREEAKESIQKCHDAGIRVIMITGDHLITAQAIAQQLGIRGKAVLGQDLERIDLDKEINNIGVFARVNPEHKMEIVTALKNKGYVVAMTGDGVNDAPALKKADIGIAMGITGTDVAKEASDMILTDDNFTSIVNAVEEGRGIFDNLRKFVNYLLSTNLGEIAAIVVASLFGLPLPLTAIQILWVNLVTDGLPATALSIDPHQEGIMKRPPRPAKESILSRELGWEIIGFGTLIGVMVVVLFWLYQSNLAKAQTMAFTSLVIFEFARLVMIRSDYKLKFLSNPWLLLAILVSLGAQLAVTYTPLNKIFGIVPLDLADWLIILGGAVLLLMIHFVVELVEKLWKRHSLAQNAQ